MIRIIGTHHLMKEKEIEKEIDKFNPEIVLVELCNGRITLIEHPELIPKAKFSLLRLIVESIKKKAEKENVVYGQDMISVYQISKKRGIKVGLIDRPMVETKILFGAIPLREKLVFLKQLISFSSKKVKVKDIINEIDNMEIQKVLSQIKSKCPEFFYYIITSRDEYMVNKIKGYLYDYPDKKILAFVGKGHVDKIKKEVFKREGYEKLLREEK